MTCPQARGSGSTSSSSSAAITPEVIAVHTSPPRHAIAREQCIVRQSRHGFHWWPCAELCSRDTCAETRLGASALHIFAPDRSKEQDWQVTAFIIASQALRVSCNGRWIAGMQQPRR
eukprot:2482998-Amphidinium_carterae.1